MSTTNLKTAADRPRQDGVPIAINALAGGASTSQAARQARLEEAVVAGWLDDPDFRRQVSDARERLVMHASGRLARFAVKAADTLAAVLDDDRGAVRIAAAKALLATCSQYREGLEFEERIRNLERRARARQAARGLGDRR